MQEAVTLLEKGVLGVHKGKHLQGREEVRLRPTPRGPVALWGTSVYLRPSPKREETKMPLPRWIERGIPFSARGGKGRSRS